MIKSILEQAKSLSGEFHCGGISSSENTKVVGFSHVVEAPRGKAEVPSVGDAQEFYTLAGSLTLFFCQESDEAAFYIAHPDEWEDLEEGFSDWVDMLDEDEKEEALPSWFDSQTVIGEIPATGNYILLITAGEESGSIYEFDHDGFEFNKLGSSMAGFVESAIDPDANALLHMASHMRFISGNTDQQWWIKELHHSTGKVVKNGS